MPYIYLWKKNCNFAPARVLLPLQSKLCWKQKIFYIVLSDIRITRVTMNVSFLWHSLHYLQGAKRLYCAKHHTKSQMLHTKNGLDKQVETITFPRGLQQAKTGKSGGEGTGKRRQPEKKRVPATDVSTHGKMQGLTISFPSQLTSDTRSFFSFLKESLVNWGKGHLASHYSKSYKVLPNTNTFLCAIHRFSQVHDSWIGLPSPF